MADLTPAQQDLLRVLGPLDGSRILGGCDDCDAYQRVVPIGPGVWSILVMHDDWCPTLARIEARADA